MEGKYIQKPFPSFLLLCFNKETFSISILTWTLSEEKCCYSNWSVIFSGREHSRQELGLFEDFHEALRTSLFRISWAFFVLSMYDPSPLSPTPTPSPSRTGTDTELVPRHRVFRFKRRFGICLSYSLCQRDTATLLLRESLGRGTTIHVF